MTNSLVPLGQVVATPAALEALTRASQTPQEFLARHVAGDFGEVDSEDWRANEEAITDGSRILSSFTLNCGQKLWIITEADRSSTCLLLADEY